MNRREAIGIVETIRNTMRDEGLIVDGDNWSGVLEGLIEYLSGPKPDPYTGLVPCGCGGKAETHELYGDFSGTYMTDCKKCATGTTQYSTKKEAQDAWNTAMGLPEVGG